MIVFVLCATYIIIVENKHLMKSKKLIKCTKCPPGWGVLKKCANETDTICEKFPAGIVHNVELDYTKPKNVHLIRIQFAMNAQPI
ncbi:hypothetical protein Phum_PHUM276580 [Pediculus humanus corporis]|uniref:Uncharacterized protein n=1 Tax=Pediculus humanus subsp. corporis TaxID=121224 RepID=E0VL00_PEDHC|nr:uncharacterized protein Phum_PHUM276580 [Pediculus humanus corporis]EEB14056.1 hypothetical protein Phum_PHUM276580 [Pediculus humanus corporis]